VSRATPPSDRSKRRASSHDTGRHHASDDGPTSIDGPRVRDGFPDTGRIDATNVDGPSVEAPVDAHDTVSNKLEIDEAEGTTVAGGEPDFGFDFDGDDDPTIYRGDRPPKPSSSRRLSPTLMKVFQRKREQIGLSIQQLAKLTGIDEEELLRFEGTNGQHRMIYDHVVLVARVLGIRPNEMPGLRSARDAKDAAGAALGSLQTALLAGPVLTFEGKSGERFGGDLERLGTTPHFAVRIGDGSLGEGWPKGALLGFIVDTSPTPGDVVLVRNKRVKQLGLRRASAQGWAPLASWQPAYPHGGDWLAMARLQVLLPRL
jgi:hypothetical protein